MTQAIKALGVVIFMLFQQKLSVQNFANLEIIAAYVDFCGQYLGLEVSTYTPKNTIN